MSYPMGSALPGTFFFLRNGQLADPTSPPVIVRALYPDGTLLSSLPALVKVATGIYYCPAVFTAAQTATLNGDYMVFVATTDTTVERPTTFWSWEVQAVPAPATVTTSAFSGAAATAIADIKTELDAVKAKTDTISEGGGSVPVPTIDNNVLTVYRGPASLALASLSVTFVPEAIP